MTKKLTYKAAGVDITKAEQFVKAIKEDVKSTAIKGAMFRSSAFGSLFALDTKKYKEPVLVSSSDGVGTKLLIAQRHNIHDTVGIDLVAMNVNDILCVGAKPLFFQDYIACGKLDPAVLKKVVKGIVKGCKDSGCTLIGGETAEMPDLYKKDEYDLAGFTVGVVDKSKIIDGSNIAAGDIVVGLPSSGIHSNGYSLVRKVLSLQEQKAYLKQIIKPTKIYAKEIALILKKFQPKAIAHITGGAYYDKLTKVLPKGKCFHIYKDSWPVPFIFKKMQSRGRIADSEMYRTFNMGIGMAIVVKSREASRLVDYLKKNKVRSYIIGEVIKHDTYKVII